MILIKYTYYFFLFKVIKNNALILLGKNVFIFITCCSENIKYVLVVLESSNINGHTKYNG